MPCIKIPYILSFQVSGLGDNVIDRICASKSAIQKLLFSLPHTVNHLNQMLSVSCFLRVRSGHPGTESCFTRSYVRALVQEHTAAVCLFPFSFLTDSWFITAISKLLQGWINFLQFPRMLYLCPTAVSDPFSYCHTWFGLSAYAPVLEPTAAHPTVFQSLSAGTANSV